MNDLYPIKLMMNPPDLVKAIDVAYRTTIELAQDGPVEFVCGTFNCGECKECKTCDTVRKAEEWSGDTGIGKRVLIKSSHNKE